MVKCKICEREFKDIISLSRHIKSHKLNAKQYYDKFLKKENEGICEFNNCNNKTNFLYISTGYNKFCCRDHSCKDKETKNKIRNTCIKKFGFPTPWSNSDFLKQKQSDYFKKYGVKSPNEKQYVKEKIRKQLIEFWNSNKGNTLRDNYSKNRKGKKRTIEECKRISEGINKPENKRKFLNSINKPEVKEKRSKSMINVWKNPKIRKKYMLAIKNSVKRKIYYEIHRKRMLNGLAAYIRSFNKSPSKPQLELYKLVKLIEPEAILEFQIFKYVTDIAIPTKKIAIEYDGSYWHQNKEYDRKRQKELENLGWVVLRFVDYIPSICELREKFCKIGEN